MPPPPELLPRLAQVRLLALDVDGVLTDGRITWGAVAAPAGVELLELKSFDVKDGLGISLARGSGLAVAWITGRASTLVAHRAGELGVTLLRQRVRDKGEALLALCADLGLDPAATAFVGDDLNDLTAYERAGVRIAVADATAPVHAAADWSTTAPGGRGAVREVIDAILAARGELAAAQERFLQALREPAAGFDPLPRTIPTIPTEQ